MSAAARTHRDAALVVLVVIGGAAWLGWPMAVALHDHAAGATIAMLAAILGCALGAAGAVTAVPRLSPATAAAGGAVAVSLIRGLLSLVGEAPRNVGTAELGAAALAAGIAAIAVALMRRRAWNPRLTALAALISFGVVTVAVVVGVAELELLDGWLGALWLIAVLAPVLGGAATALLLRASRPGHVALGWLAMLITSSAALAIADRSPLLLGPGFLSLLILGPILSGLGGLGHWAVSRNRSPFEADGLPAARVRHA